LRKLGGVIVVSLLQIKKEMKDNFFVLDKQNFFIKRAQYKTSNYFYLGYLVNHDKVWDV